MGVNVRKICNFILKKCDSSATMEECDMTPNSSRSDGFSKLGSNHHFNKNEQIPEKPVRSLFYAQWLAGILAFLLLGTICCYLPCDILLKGFKAIAFGVMAVYFSWEMLYFDSTTPGVDPPSPLSPRKMRETSCYAIDTSYLFSIVNGILFTVILYFWI